MNQSALSWEYQDDEYYNRDAWKAKRGQINIGCVIRDYNWSHSVYNCYLNLVGDVNIVHSFEEGKEWIENKFQEVCRDANLSIGEGLMNNLTVVEKG